LIFAEKVGSGGQIDRTKLYKRAISMG